MSTLIKTNALSKQYKGVYAVDNANITIKHGSIYGLIGENGAGKTTILKILSGLTQPTAGSITFFDEKGDVITPATFSPQIGALIETPGIYPYMSAFDNLRLKSLYMGISMSDEEIRELISLVGLYDVGNKRIKNYSLGMKQRLGIALALAGNPRLMILDEPINGLDPHGIVEIRNLIKKLNVERNITFIISSHILDELAKVATDYCIIHKGTVILEETKEDFIMRCGDVPIEEYFLRIIGGEGNE